MTQLHQNWFSSQGNHILYISRLNWEVLKQKSVIAIIKKVLPNDRREKLQSQLYSNLPTYAFELGPLTAPPIYKYEGGIVYRRGYQLEIQLIDQADHKILFRLSFFQGLLKEPPGWRQGSPDSKFRNEIPTGSVYFVEGNSKHLEYNPNVRSWTAYSSPHSRWDSHRPK